MTAKIPTPAALLTRAADIIDTRGWYQNGFISERGEVCMVAAMRLSAAEHVELPTIETRRACLGAKSVWPESVRDELKGVFDKAVQQVARKINGAILDEWNDQPGRTAKEVVGTLRAAAEAGAQ